MLGTRSAQFRRRSLPCWLLAPLVLLAGCGGSTVTVVSTRTVPAASPKSSTTGATTSSSYATQSSVTSTPTSVATTPTATTGSSTTGQAAANVSCGSTAHGFVTGISGSGVSCGTAVAVADSWLAQLQKGLNPAHTVSVSAAGSEFACDGHFKNGSAADVLCQGGSASQPRVAFQAHP